MIPWRGVQIDRSMVREYISSSSSVHALQIVCLIGRMPNRWRDQEPVSYAHQKERKKTVLVRRILSYGMVVFFRLPGHCEYSYFFFAPPPPRSSLDSNHFLFRFSLLMGDCQGPHPREIALDLEDYHYHFFRHSILYICPICALRQYENGMIQLSMVLGWSSRISSLG